MTFGAPHYLYALAALPALLALMLFAWRTQASRARRLGDAALIGRLSATVNRPLRAGRAALWLGAAALIIIALARPQWGSEAQIVEHRGVQVMIALDVSKSMLAEDMKPNRLERAKLEISDLLSNLTGDEVGVALFSGASFVQFPVTFDYTSARNYLAHASPDAITRQGTDIGGAIRSAERGFTEQRESQRIIIVMSDGENHEGEPIEAARDAHQDGEAVVYTVGFGTPAGGQIPDINEAGIQTGYVQDSDGATVVSRLDEAALQLVARAGGGRYFRAANPRMIENLVDAIQSYEGASIESEISQTRVERFQIFLVAAALALFAAELLFERMPYARRWRRDAEKGTAARV